MQINGEDLRLIREVEGLTQNELAEVIKCSRSRLSRLESNVLQLNQSEWFALKDQFPSLVACLFKQKNTFVDNQQIKEQIPGIYRRGQFVSYRIGSYLENLIETRLGSKGLSQFWVNEKIEPDFFRARVRCYPFDLVLRMVQWLRLNEQLKSYDEIYQLVLQMKDDPDWWGEKWNWIKKNNNSNSGLNLIEDWSIFSQNHQVVFENIENEIQITFSPSIGINKKLYFDDPILSDFPGLWAKAWVDILLPTATSIKLFKGDEQWFLRIKFSILH